MAVGMLAGRLLGLFREMLLASQFGVHEIADVAITLLIIPDFITSALIGNAVSAAFIPAYAARTRDKAIALVWQSLIVSVGVFTLIGLFLWCVWPELPDVPQAQTAFILALCSLPLAAATSSLTTYLQFRGRFTVPAFANAIFNTVIVLTLWLAPHSLALFGIGIVLAALLRLLAHVAAFIRAGGKPGVPSLSPWQMDAKLAKAYAITASSGILNLLPFYAPYAVIGYVGSSVAVFNYAFKLVMLPALLLQTLVQMVLLPWFVKRLHAGAQNYSITLRLAWLLAWVVSLCMSLTGTAIADLCFGHGKMTEDVTLQVGHLFALGVWAVPPMLIASVWQQILYANQHTGAAFISSAIQAILVLPLCWIGYESGGVAGVLIAHIIVQALPLLLLIPEGRKRGFIAHYCPGRDYTLMTAAASTAFLLLALPMQFLAVSSWVSVTIACVIGLLSLGSGLCACRDVRKWAIQQVHP